MVAKYQSTERDVMCRDAVLKGVGQLARGTQMLPLTIKCQEAFLVSKLALVITVATPCRVILMSHFETYPYILLRGRCSPGERESHP